MTLYLFHITAKIQASALLPAEERIQIIKRDRWLGYTLATEALVELKNLFLWPKRQRMVNMLIIGPTNNGKSMIIEKFKKQHPQHISKDQYQEIIPVLTVHMPSDPSIKRFYTMVMYAINYPLTRRQTLPELEVLVLQVMKKTQVKMLVIDELHNILGGSRNVRNEFLNLLRFLGNELKIPIVGVGTEDAYRAIRTDDQLENRFTPFILPRWKEGNELIKLLVSFTSILPLRFPSQLSSPEMMRYILTRTEGTIGEISNFLTYAAILAIESGEESINSKTLSLTEYDNPSERKKKFEREVI